MFIKESLRFHPPVPVFGRTLIKDITLPNGVLLPQGICSLFAAVFHILECYLFQSGVCAIKKPL